MTAREVRDGRQPRTVGGDRAYADGDDLVLKLDQMGIFAHFAARDDRPNALARVNHDDPGYAVSIRKRMRIEEIISFVKCISGLDQVKVRGHINVFGVGTMALIAYNFTRLAHLAV
ncbi:MAG: transposase [Myxococcota bacterium]